MYDDILRFFKDNLPYLEKLIRETDQDGRERGFSVTQDDEGKFHIENECLGDSCSVDLKNKTDSVAEFHTHPSLGEGILPNTFSTADILTALTEDIQVTCVGQIKYYSEDEPEEPIVTCACLNPSEFKVDLLKKYLEKWGGWTKNKGEWDRFMGIWEHKE